MDSLDYLADEVTQFVVNYISICAAEELHFGDKVLSYHEGANRLTSKSEAEHDHDGHHRGRDHHHHHHKKPKKDAHTEQTSEAMGKRHGELHQAVADAKSVLKRAIEDIGGMPSEGPLVEMKKEIALLRKGNDEMKNEINMLKIDFKNLCDFVRSSCPFEQIRQPVIKQPAKQRKQTAENEDFNLFGSTDEDEDVEKERIKQERLKAYAEKKAKKPAAIAKSSVILEIKPWDDETNMAEMEALVRKIEQDGLVWGGGKLIPLAYGIKKLQIICVVEDEKVSVDDLIDKIVEDIPDHVQSVDIIAFNKI